MSSASAARPLEVRHLQLARAVAAAIAAAMVTFSPDHSSAFGLSVFSGFAILTAIMMFAAAWLVYPRGRRGAAVLIGVLDVVAGMIAGIGPLRSDTTFFVLVAVWALATGVAEGVVGLRARRAGLPDARDAIFIGALGVVLAIALLCVPAGYALNYTIDEAHQTFTLTGITIGVGIFGAYTAIAAVYLGIAGFSPRKDATPELAAASDEHPGGAA
ncbi:acyl-CoA synthetase [Microbacterium protaetiae]|uniref:Acyl-CoA synthetase n=1 Tax=Microbacterium protaetiae TaxID=2509458 RepID=A0A4P6EC43_9MICO|nr:DUF308 domain-containing protein [Microbacterium protaetiae]QAY59584.1 acyl-CoA synthetase [Microbacterium protaetiae]